MNNIDTTCPHCGFDFKTLKPSSKLEPCPCGKSYADVTSLLIRVLYDDVPVKDKD